ALASIPGSPAAVRRKVLQRKTHRVEKFVATGARLVLAVQGLLLTHAQNFSRLPGGVFQRRNVRRRFGRRRAENIVEDPHASFDRRVSIGNRSDRQNASFTEQSATVIQFRAK